MWIARTIEQLRQHRNNCTGQVALVPTMGALHTGHISHIEAIKPHAQNTIVSIFVNPAQFAPDEDLDRYPRPLDEDLKLCENAGVDGVFLPSPQEMYQPTQLDSFINIPALANILEGKVRPTHFQGVCRVVVKLFNIIQPHIASFGQKDYQQLKVIEALVDDLNFPIRIAQIPTMREHDGLAMSSRNVYLDPQQRKRAMGMYKALNEARMLVEQAEESDPQQIETVMKDIMKTRKIDVNYAVIRHPQTLIQLDCIEPKLTKGVVALVAGHVDNIHLIDNMLLAEPKS